MPTIAIERLKFDFPQNWEAEEFDNWSYYRKQFARLANARLICSKCDGTISCPECGSKKVAGAKGIDILALDTAKCCWLIEVKDYRSHARTKVIELADEVALKTRDTLAAMFAAKVHASDAEEKQFAGRAAKCVNIRVVLHLEQPVKHSKLFPRAIDPADVLQRLKQLIKAIDPHPLVLEKSRTMNVPWRVQGI